MKVLVLGGTGHVGREVVRRLASGGDEICFTWHRAERLAAELPGRGIQVDLAEAGAAKWLIEELSDFPIQGLAHCAGLRDAAEIDEGARLERAVRLYAEAARVGIRALAAAKVPAIRNAVLLGAWSPGQSLPMAVPFAASQGALVTVAMAMGRELAPRGVRVNVVGLGLLDGGAAEAVSADQQDSYRHFAALRRVGTAEEVAATVVWLLRENRVCNGKVLAANGGL